MPRAEASVDWACIGDAVRRVHELPVSDVPAGYPIPSPEVFPWWNFEFLLREASDVLDDSSRRGLEAAVDRHSGWQRAIRADAVVCHGDVHPGNVLMSGDRPLLIDWDLLCTANRGWDHAMLTTYADRWGGARDVYPAFAEGYRANLADDDLTVALGDLRNVAATLMRVRAGRSDPSRT